MKLFVFIIVVLLTSCSGVLWDGIEREITTETYTITVEFDEDFYLFYGD